MKALSIKQPWASLIAHGIKDIENRTWKTNFRGRIYIHASLKTSAEPYHLFTEEQWTSIDKNNKDFDVFQSYKNVSAIIGEVDVVDCVINHPSIWAEKTDFSQEDPESIWNWVLANPILYDKPILNVKGKLSFWEWEGCEQECTSCDHLFDMMNMQRDGDDNYFCKECADELFPIMQKEYDEMVAKGEIEPED